MLANVPLAIDQSRIVCFTVGMTKNTTTDTDFAMLPGEVVTVTLLEDGTFTIGSNLTGSTWAHDPSKGTLMLGRWGNPHREPVDGVEPF